MYLVLAYDALWDSAMAIETRGTKHPFKFPKNGMQGHSKFYKHIGVSDDGALLLLKEGNKCKIYRFSEEWASYSLPQKNALGMAPFTDSAAYHLCEDW
nr:hypothetical protein Iba_chr07dCG4850 [Ipomoea batatas]